MIGGYAQLAYGFNYYGTVGCQPRRIRDRAQDEERGLAGRPSEGPARRRRPPPSPRRALMKIRAQIGMVLNLDKCIGCHTCSVTCKNVWTSRDGVEYAWFNNVETKPGIGYPKEWENQDKWNGGWVQRQRQAGAAPRRQAERSLANIFANPNLPEIDDYYEPFTYDYEHLQNAPRSKTPPTARPRSLITGKRMDKIEWGPNWEDDPGRRVRQARQRRRTSTMHPERDLLASSKTPS